MPKLRDTDDLDVEALEAVEYSTEKFTDYSGEVPPIGLTLSGYVKRMWWTRTQKDDPMLKILWEASDNDGDNDEYNGCPIWLNAALIPGAKFRWDPFLNAYGLTLSDVKTKTYVDKKEDQNGAPIQRIGTWKPGADRDEAWCWVVTDQEDDSYGLKAIAGEWLPWDEAPETPEAAADEEPEDEEPELFEDEEGNLVNAEGEPVDEDGNVLETEDEDEEDAEDEEPEEPEPPARTRRSTARSAKPARSTRSAQPARGSRTASKPARTAPATRTRAAAGKPATARTARAKPAPARSSGRATATATAPARSTRTKRRAADNEPPF